MTKAATWALHGSSAFSFVLTMGVVNLFADMTYEGGASVNGPFLGSLGANAAAISIVAGAGEFLGYSLRSVAGLIADRTGKYWLITFFGYSVNLLAVPAMALANSWQMAALLILLERTGRAIRKPTVEAMLSCSTGKHGKGWVYAARPQGFTRSYALYMAAGAFFAAGLMSFELISYHLSTTGIVTAHRIPLFLALATAFSVAATLVLGRLYDRIGIAAVVGAVLVASAFSPLVFFGGFWLALAGLLLWGVGYATQDTLLKALIASVLPEGRRNLAFGLFYLSYGGGWLLGSVTTGLLYEHSRVGLVVFAVVAQLASIPFFVLASRANRDRAQ